MYILFSYVRNGFSLEMIPVYDISRYKTVTIILHSHTNSDILILERDVVPFMVRWIVGSITHGGPTGLFLVPASAPRLLY